MFRKLIGVSNIRVRNGFYRILWELLTNLFELPRINVSFWIKRSSIKATLKVVESGDVGAVITEVCVWQRHRHRRIRLMGSDWTTRGQSIKCTSHGRPDGDGGDANFSEREFPKTSLSTFLHLPESCWCVTFFRGWFNLNIVVGLCVTC